MKKMITMAILMMVMTQPVMAATPMGTTPRYKPVSSQAWYKSYQNALNQASNVKVDLSNVKIDLSGIDFSKIKINL